MSCSFGFWRNAVSSFKDCSMRKVWGASVRLSRQHLPDWSILGAGTLPGLGHFPIGSDVERSGSRCWAGDLVPGILLFHPDRWSRSSLMVCHGPLRLWPWHEARALVRLDLHHATFSPQLQESKEWHMIVLLAVSILFQKPLAVAGICLQNLLIGLSDLGFPECHGHLGQLLKAQFVELRIHFLLTLLGADCCESFGQLGRRSGHLGHRHGWRYTYQIAIAKADQQELGPKTRRSILVVGLYKIQWALLIWTWSL